MIDYKGKWAIDWDRFSASKTTGCTSFEEYCSTTLTNNGQTTLINDVCPIEKNGESENFYMTVIPFGDGCTEIDAVVENCDLLMYVEDRKPAKVDFSTILKGDLNALVPLIKQHGYHAEAGYRNHEGKACQVGLWGNDPSDRIFHTGNTGKNVINIFRLTFPGMQEEKQKRLKDGIHKWKRIFNRHTFPDGANMEMCSDPVDFTTFDELAEIARKLFNRRPDSPTALEKVNCVQWTCQAISLAVNFPLTRAVIKDLSVDQAFDQYWRGVVDYSEDELSGIGMLPIRFYTPARALQVALDMYCPGVSFLENLKKLPVPLLAAALTPYVKSLIPPSTIQSYVDALIKTGDLDFSFDFGLGRPYKVVMPSTFLVESREHVRNPPTNTPAISYVATAVHKDFVCENTH